MRLRGGIGPPAGHSGPTAGPLHEEGVLWKLPTRETYSRMEKLNLGSAEECLDRWEEPLGLLDVREVAGAGDDEKLPAGQRPSPFLTSGSRERICLAVHHRRSTLPNPGQVWTAALT